jgi:hypothetical protein
MSRAPGRRTSPCARSCAAISPTITSTNLPVAHSSTPGTCAEMAAARAFLGMLFMGYHRYADSPNSRGKFGKKLPYVCTGRHPYRPPRGAHVRPSKRLSGQGAVMLADGTRGGLIFGGGMAEPLPSCRGAGWSDGTRATGPILGGATRGAPRAPDRGEKAQCPRLRQIPRRR